MIGLFTVQSQLLTAFKSTTVLEDNIMDAFKNASIMDLKEEVFKILDTKCNVCHRKQNPFRVFKLKNMDKNAKRIYKQVFVYRRMPKGGEIQLTEEEYQTLKKWIKTKNIN